jgi:hypothetical protein
MTLEYLKYIVWALEQSKNIRLLFIHLRQHLEIWVELYSRHNSWESLFINNKNTIHNSTINENTRHLFIICTSLGFFLFSKFLPLKVG